MKSTGDGAFDMILKLKDVDEMFDLVCVGNYMRGRLDGMSPVEESRAVFKRIKGILAKQKEGK